MHARAERPIRSDLDGLAFEPPRRIKEGEIESSLRWHQGKFQIATVGTRGQPGVFEAVRVIGETPLRQLLVAGPRGQMQVTSLAFDPIRRDWFDVFGSDHRQPEDWSFWANRGMNWNSMCAACHNTGVRKNYDFQSDRYRTELVEFGVGCEACHGPAQEHVRRQRAHPGARADATLKRPKPKALVDLCGTCHSRRAELTERFRPGDLFLDHYAPELPGHSAVYYPDGQVHDEDYEYVSFLLSRMYREGVHCMDCHEPHSGRLRAAGNDLCLRCHKGKIEPRRHSHHRTDQPGGQCVACHMPVTNYMVRQPRHDHGFTIPDPELTLEYNVPNACNRCHESESPQWAAEAVRRWFASDRKRHSALRARLIARVRQNDFSAALELANQAIHETSPAWRAVAAGLLAPWANVPEIQAVLQRLSKDADPLVRTMALGSFEDLGRENDDLLRPFLHDPVRSVRVRAASILRGEFPPGNPSAKELETHLNLIHDQPAGALMKGAYLQEHGRTEEAVLTLRRALSWDPQMEPGWESLAVALGQGGRVSEAISVLQEGCAKISSSARLRYLLGLGRAEWGDLEGAVQALREACFLQPGMVRAWYNLGLALHQLKRESAALDALNRAAELEPSNAQYPFTLATVYRDLGQFDQAKRAAHEALRLDARHREAQHLLLWLEAAGQAKGQPSLQ